MEELGKASPRCSPPPTLLSQGWVVFLGITWSLERAQNLPLMIRNVLAFHILLRSRSRREPPELAGSARTEGTRPERDLMDRGG